MGCFPSLLRADDSASGPRGKPFDNSINSIKGKRSSRITLRWNEGCRGLEAFLRVPLDLWPSDKEGIKSQQG